MDDGEISFGDPWSTIIKKAGQIIGKELKRDGEEIKKRDAEAAEKNNNN